MKITEKKKCIRCIKAVRFFRPNCEVNSHGSAVSAQKNESLVELDNFLEKENLKKKSKWKSMPTILDLP